MDGCKGVWILDFGEWIFDWIYGWICEWSYRMFKAVENLLNV